MSNTKVSSRVALNWVLDNVEEIPQEIREKLEVMVVALDKKKSSTKPTKNQLENQKIGEMVYNILSTEKKFLTLKEIIAGLGENYKEMSTQKITAIIKPYLESGKVVKGGNRKAVAYGIVGIADTEVEGE